jgi:hypothetical protein
MPNPAFRSWTEADNAKLESLAGKLPTAEIAAELGRSESATVTQASKLKVSLKIKGFAEYPADSRKTSRV